MSEEKADPHEPNVQTPEPTDRLLLPTNIDSVTVYSDAAHVTRTASSDLPAGRSLVELRGLPPGLNAAHLRLMTDLGRVVSVESDEVTITPNITSDTTALEEAIKQQRAKIIRLMGEISGQQTELALMDAIAPQPIREGNTVSAPTLRPDIFLSGLDLLGKRRLRTAYDHHNTEVMLEEAREELRALEKRAVLAGNTAGSADKESVLVIGIETDEPGATTIEVTYLIDWATWRPRYHLRLDPDQRTIECLRYADLWQETLEDWRRIDLSLSTSEPEEGLRLPTITPWRLRGHQAYQDQAGALYAQRPSSSSNAVEESWSLEEDDAFEDLVGSSDELDLYAQQFEEEGHFAEITSAGVMRGRTAMMSDAATDARDEAATGPVFPAAEEPLPQIGRRRRTIPFNHPDWGLLRDLTPPSAGGFDCSFSVPKAATCESGHQKVRLFLGAERYPMVVRYLLRPAVREHAFASVEVVNREALPMLAGPASIFVQEDFFGESAIETTPARGKLVLQLGAETAIRSARRTNTTIRSTKLLGNSDTHTVEVVTEIENLTAQKAFIRVEDQIPVSEDKNVKITFSKSTLPQEADELTGLLTFSLTIPSGEKRTLSFTYEIEVPRNYELYQYLAEAV